MWFKWLEKEYEDNQRFTKIEIDAERFRQSIQQAKKLKKSPPGFLKAEKEHLAFLEHRAEMAREGRAARKEYLEMMQKLMQTGTAPGWEKSLGRLHAHTESLEKTQKLIDRAHFASLRNIWPRADWETRKILAKNTGFYGSRRLMRMFSVQSLRIVVGFLRFLKKM